MAEQFEKAVEIGGLFVTAIQFLFTVTGKDQNVFRIVGLHVLQILVDRICGSSIPVAAFASLVRRKNRNAADVAV